MAFNSQNTEWGDIETNSFRHIRVGHDVGQHADAQKRTLREIELERGSKRARRERSHGVDEGEIEVGTRGKEEDESDEFENDYNDELGEEMAELAAAPERGPIKLAQEQEDLVQLAKDGQNIFYTGAAGAGKSVVLSVIVECLQREGKNVHVTAPTGIAALNVGGTTTWTYLGISPYPTTWPYRSLRGWYSGTSVTRGSPNVSGKPTSLS
jgi:hypothetical protein